MTSTISGERASSTITNCTYPNSERDQISQSSRWERPRTVTTSYKQSGAYLRVPQTVIMPAETTILQEAAPADLDSAMRHIKACRRHLERQPATADVDKLIVRIVEVLNATEGITGGLEAKECCLEVLSQLAGVRSNCDAIAGSLSDVEDSFEKAFMSIATLDQPTAENMESHLLILLLRITQHNFTARDLLEMANGRIPLAVDCLLSTIRAQPPRQHAADLADIHCSCLRLLYELTLPESYFQAASGDLASSMHGSTVLIAGSGKPSSGTSDTNAMPIDALTALYHCHVNTLIAHILDRPLFQSIVTVFKPWIVANTAAKTHMKQSVSGGELDAISHASMGHLLAACQNLLLFSTEHGAKLRQHMATTTGLMQDIVLPYTSMCIAAVSAVEDAAAADLDLLPVLQRLLASLRCALALLSVACYKIRVLRPSLRDGKLLSAALAVPAVSNDVFCLASLVQFAVNADMLLRVDGAGNRPALGTTTKKLPLTGAAVSASVNYALQSLLTAAVEGLDAVADDARIRFARRIVEGEEKGAPIVSSGTTFDLLKHLWKCVDVARQSHGGQQQQASSSSSDSKEGNDEDATAAAAKAALVANLRAAAARSYPAAAAAASSSPVGAGGQLSSGARAPHHLPPLRRMREGAAKQQQPASPAAPPPPKADSEFFAPRCALSGRILSEPIILLVPAGQPLQRKAEAGAFTLAWSTGTSASKGSGASDSKASQEGKDDADSGSGNFVAYYCERDAVEEAIEESGGLCPFSGRRLAADGSTGEDLLVSCKGNVLQPRKGDPVMAAVQQWQLRRMMAAAP